jgi:hypothetical protein
MYRNVKFIDCKDMDSITNIESHLLNGLLIS